MRVIGFLCSNVNPLSLFKRNSPNHLLMTVLILVSLLQGFTETFSSWIGISSLTKLSIPFTILIQDTVWSWHKDWNLNFNAVPSVVIANFCPRPGQIVHCFGSILLFEFLHDVELSYILGKKIHFLFLLVTEKHRRNCPTSTDVKPASEHCLDKFWSSDNFSNRCSYNFNKFPCRSSLACIPAIGNCVIISTLCSWPGALGYPWLSDQLVILQSHPLHWLLPTCFAS